MTLTNGQILKERYRIDGGLGGGGFGEVYLAYDLSLEGHVAIKESLDVSPQAEANFKREAVLLFKIDHPNLPRVLDRFSLPGQGHYLVMQYIAGEDLQTLLDRQNGRPLEATQSLVWIAQVCDALTYLHSQDPPIIHRDIKPANIRITPQGKAVLVDFGIAKLYDPHKGTVLGARAGSPGYYPPEQGKQGGTDARSDIYSVGATLYKLLTGVTPPDSLDISTGEAPFPLPARMVNPQVSEAASAAVSKAMQLHRSQRFPNVAEFKGALFGAVPVDEPTRSHRTQSMRPTRDWRRLLRPGALALLLVVVGAAVVIWRLAGGGKPLMPQPSPMPGSTVTASLPVSLPVATTELLPIVIDTQVNTSTSAPPTLAFTPTATPYPDRITVLWGVPMILIPAGPFTMGIDPDVALAECQKLYIGGTCDRDWFTDATVHTVNLSAYYIDRTEVTNARYAECVQAGECTEPQYKSSYLQSSYYGNAQFADYPVIFVTWEQANTYCEWRGGYLPSEAQWEKAARGTEDRLYPWGNSFDGTKANFCDKSCTFDWANKAYDDGYADTAPVGSYPQGASPYGVLDMAGNVWEWVADWYSDKYYQTSPGDNPINTTSSGVRVLRGGTWYNSGNYLLSSDRYRNDPTYFYIYIGFRCARSP